MPGCAARVPCAQERIAVAMSASVQVFGRRHDGLSMRRGGRRPKSAKARNRGGWGTRRCGGRDGDLGG